MSDNNSDNNSNAELPLFFTGFLIGLGMSASIFFWGVGSSYEVARQYQECVDIGAPAENCLQKYVLSLNPQPNQKGE